MPMRFVRQAGYTLALIFLSVGAFGQKEIDLGKMLKWTKLINGQDLMPAISFGEEYLAEIEQKWGTQNDTYAGFSILLAKLYIRVNNYKKAKDYAEKSIQISRKISGKDQLYASYLSTLGNIYIELGEYWKAKNLLEECSEITKVLNGENSQVYATSLYNLAGIYMDINYYDPLEKLYQTYLNIWRQQKGKDNIPYAKGLNNLAALYERIGQLNKVEPLIQEALAIYQLRMGEKKADFFNDDSTHYATTVSHLAGYYSSIEQYSKAVEVYQQAYQIMNRVAHEKAPAYIGLLNQIAMTYTENKQFHEADSLYKKSLKIILNNTGSENLDYSVALNNLGDLYARENKIRQADSLFNYSLEIKRKLFGSDNIRYANSLNNLSTLFIKIKQYDKADSLLKISVEINEKKLGKEHPGYIATLYKYAQLQVLKQNWVLADSLLRVNLQAQLNQSRQYSQFLSEHENAQIQKSFSQLFDFLTTVYVQHSDHLPEASSTLLNTALYLKGNVLQNMDLLRHRVAASGDTSLSNIFTEWQLQKRVLVQQAQNPTHPISAELKERVEQLEKQLTRQSQNFRLLEESSQLQWKDIQGRLKPNQAAIEFIRYTVYQGVRRTDSTYYIALITRPAYRQPQLIRLCAGKDLEALMRQGKANQRPANQLYASRGSALLGSSRKIYGRKLYQLIWEPLERYLADVEDIFYAPDGDLHKLSFAAIPLTETSLLSSKYKLYQRFSTRTVAKEPDQTLLLSTWKAAVYGGSIYKSDSAAQQLAIHQKNYSDEKIAANTPLPLHVKRGNNLAYLPGTLAEATAIHTLLRIRQYSSILLTGWQSNEESFKAFGYSSVPQILHVATHGFFFPPLEHSQETSIGNSQPDKLLYQTFENPLLRSGLLLAGAERVWRGGQPLTGLEDGILTAYEIAQLNLDQTELIVLSACETGLGDVSGNEGVYGLQRAFKLAGAKRLIMSLWKIPDKETSEFMIEFYRAWIDKTPIEEAFLRAQSVMRDRYKKEPLKWAGFVLVS